jgi:hypothetical protein
MNGSLLPNGWEVKVLGGLQRQVNQVEHKPGLADDVEFDGDAEFFF